MFLLTFAAPAKIISFSRELVASWQQNVLLPCMAVGDPEPEISWITRYTMFKDHACDAKLKYIRQFSEVRERFS